MSHSQGCLYFLTRGAYNIPAADQTVEKRFVLGKHNVAGEGWLHSSFHPPHEAIANRSQQGFLMGWLHSLFSPVRKLWVRVHSAHKNRECISCTRMSSLARMMMCMSYGPSWSTPTVIVQL
ncbi:hypothetical protein GUJ93_ZPchr0003g18549 [Zizania palustris]|uniref:Uncharacterized protein n=1 Tax=Zizania palustris TaxID=103762 RepID=A0A8J5S9X0_ZIZPA|nr:hypothetical protein GUJ93_ZPchr0003g18549 [Zizania palustris]